MGSVVESYLRNHEATSLDLVVSTHPHEDHIGGLATILNSLPVKQVLDSGQSHTTATFENYLNIIDRKNIPFDTAREVRQLPSTRPLRSKSSPTGCAVSR